jgi:hypothetical protein
LLCAMYSIPLVGLRRSLASNAGRTNRRGSPLALASVTASQIPMPLLGRDWSAQHGRLDSVVARVTTSTAGAKDSASAAPAASAWQGK